MATACAALAAGVAAAPAATIVQWCGSTADAGDRPDSVTGHQIHIAYAIPSDGADRFLSVASGIASDFASIDQWWRRHDPSRTPRFDLAAFPGCTSELGALDISSIRLANTTAHYAANATRFERIHADAFVPALGFAHPAKKYVILYDAPVESPPLWCGAALSEPARGGAAGAAVVLLQAPGCRTRLGEAGRGASTMVHEIIHALGALAPIGPPHACPGDLAHPCDSEVDILRAGRTEDMLDNLVLDVGRDDYYAHPGSWWDVQDSPWLRRLDQPRYTLELVVEGPGAIAVDLPGGGTCSSRCVTEWDAGTTVALAVTPAPGARVRSIEGPCTVSGCSLTLDGPKRIRAVFVQPVRFSVARRGTGRGIVTSAPRGINCGTACSAMFDAGRQLRITARPAKGSVFVRWTGACRGTKLECRLVVGRPATAVAWFRPKPRR